MTTYAPHLRGASLRGWIVLALLAFPASASAQAPQAYKMLILGNDGITVTDYPSEARCEAARAAILRLMERENRDLRPEPLPNGGLLIKAPLSLRTHCIPG